MEPIWDIDSLETGDLLLFSGKGYWFSYVVEYLTWSDFSHIGMVLRDPTYLDPKLKGLYMLESGTENFPDAIEHRLHYGVQVVNLEKVLEHYVGRVYLRKLKINSTQRKNSEVVLPQIWNTIKDKPYDDHIWDLICVEFGLKWGNTHRVDNFFCSALITFLYEKFDYITVPLEWDLILPKDYESGGKIDKILEENVNLDLLYQLK
jgi:hypothetical protein